MFPILTGVGGGGFAGCSKGFMGVISKLIAIYETTARVISGANAARGESITLSL